MNNYNATNIWIPEAKRRELMDRIERMERERLARIKQARNKRIARRSSLLVLLAVVGYFLLINADYIRSTIVLPSINFALRWWHYLYDTTITYYVSFDYWVHVRLSWSWLSDHLHLEKHGSIAGAFFDVAGIVHSYGLIVPFFLVFWMVGRLFDRDMTALDAALCLGKWILIIAIFAALLYGAIIFIALAALAVCGPLVAGGVARPAVSHRMRW
jgi:hypothetical protein